MTEFESIDGVDKINTLHLSPGLLETKNSLKGVTIKGLSDSTMVVSSLTRGSLPSTETGIVLSEVLANRLILELGDRVSIYIVENRESIKPRTLKVCGFYDTGLLEYDEKFVFVSPALLQNAGSAGAQATIKIEDGKAKGKVFGKNENCLLYTSPSPRDVSTSRMPSSA